jgi:cell division septation protein DedD
MSSMARFPVAGAGLIAALMLLGAGPALAAPVLVVESLVGEASSEHLGAQRPLQVGDSIGEREVLRTAADARLGLRLTGDGLLELGANAVLAIEKLPSAPEARDQRSIASLMAGYLRVIAPLPAAANATPKPFVLYTGGKRIGLPPGEYFFDRGSDAIRSCVASGRPTITAIAGDGVEPLNAGACYALQPTPGAKPEAITALQFDAVRREYTTRPTGKLPPVAAVVAAVPTVAIPRGSEARPAPVVTVPPAPARSATPGVSTVPTSPVTPPPAVAPAPAPSLAAPAAAELAASHAAPASVGWSLLVGSFADPANAEQAADKLRGIGYEPFLQDKEIDGRIWHRVQVRGSYASREIAEDRAADVRSRLGYDNVRVVHLD